MSNPITMVRVNNLQYNSNRDPQVYRRVVNEDFTIQAVLDGQGSAKVRFEVEGAPCCEEDVSLPGKFNCNTRFDSAGTRIGKLVVEAGGESHQQYIRLDTTEHAWIG